jgi:hypothetical protein
VQHTGYQARTISGDEHRIFQPDTTEAVSRSDRGSFLRCGAMIRYFGETRVQPAGML